MRSQRRSASVYARCMASVSALELERVAPAAAGAGSTRSSESTTLLTMLVPTLPTESARAPMAAAFIGGIHARRAFGGSVKLRKPWPRPLNLYMCTGYSTAVYNRASEREGCVPLLAPPAKLVRSARV
eukprot:scaffold68173_cov69-Phaeocystis_antarctica.AAC.2